MPDDMAAAAAVVVPQTLVGTHGMVAYVRLVPRLATTPETVRQVLLPSWPLKGLAVLLGRRPDLPGSFNAGRSASLACSAHHG